MVRGKINYKIVKQTEGGGGRERKTIGPHVQPFSNHTLSLKIRVIYIRLVSPPVPVRPHGLTRATPLALGIHPHYQALRDIVRVAVIK